MSDYWLICYVHVGQINGVQGFSSGFIPYTWGKSPFILTEPGYQYVLIYIVYQ